MEIEILQNNFETIYKEYKDYAFYIDSTTEEINKQRDAFKERIVGGEDEEVLLRDLFDLSIKPIQSDSDLRILRDRLLFVYDAYKIVIDFPSEIKEEMNNLKRPYQAYRIFNGAQIEIDKEKNDKFKEEARKSHSEFINAIRIK